jgi:lysophospholipase L1-like esterase
MSVAHAPGRLSILAASLLGVSVAAARPAETVNVLFDGDSISAGVGAPHGRGLDAQVAAALGPDVALHNVAAGGRPVSECLALYAKLVAPQYAPAAGRNVIAFHAGDNDIARNSSAEQAYAAFTAYVAAAHAQGWAVVVSTEMRRPDFPQPKEAQLEAYNALLRRNEAGADAVVDFDRDPRIADFVYRTDPAIFAPDRIHPSEAGYAILSDMLAPAVRRLAGR